MKKLYSVFVILSCLFYTTNLFAQSASITWPLNNTTLLTSASLGNVTGSAESISSGSGQFGMSVFDYNIDGQRLWEGTAGWIAGSEELNRYIQFNALPTSGNSFTVTSVSFNYRDFANSINTNFLNCNAYYSIDNWTNRVPLNSNPLVYLNSALSSFNKTLSVTVTAGSTFSLRIYPYAIHNSLAMSPTFAIHNNIVISGTTAPEVGSICGMKFNDLNGNGVKDAGEPGLPDWQIKISGTADSTIITDKDGNYCFNNLAAGTYTVAEVYQTGWQQTTASAYTVALTAGQQLDDMNFGNRHDDPAETCIVWNLLSSKAVTSVGGNVTALPESIGVGSPVLSTGLTAYLMSIYGYSNGQQLWVGNVGGTWIPDPPNTPDIDPLRYVQFDASPIPGNSFTVTEVFFNYGDIPWSTDFNILAFKAYYSTDGWTTPGTALNTTALVYKNTAMLPFNKSISVLVPSGQTFSLRIYPYPILHGITIIPSFATHNNVEICGTTAPVTEQKCITPPDSMVAWWPLDETSGSTSIDIAGFNNSGTRINGPIPVPAKVLGGLQFDGINDYVEVPDHPELNFGTGNFSIDAWIKTTDNKSYNTMIVDKQTLNGSVIRGYSFYLTIGYLSLQLSDGQFTNYASLVNVADGNWHHIAVTVSRGLHNGILFYKDGVASPVGDPTMRPGSLDNTGPLTIGRQSYTDQFEFKGVLDEIELFNRVLSAGEIYSIFAADSAGKCKPGSLGSICGMKFNDLNGNGVKDAGEPGLTDWQIKISGAVDSTIITDKDGNYCFNNLAAGTYTVAEVYQTGWQQTTASAYTVALTAGQQLDDMNFGNRHDDPAETCIVWNLLSSKAVTSVVGNVTALPESIGVGSPVLSTGLTAYLMSIYGYSNGQQLWVGNVGGTWIPDPPNNAAIDSLRYIQFDASPIPGNSFTVTNVSFNYGDLPWSTDFNILAFKAYYSTDGWTTPGTALNTPEIVYKNTAMLPFNKSISVLVPSGKTFSLRIYPYPILHGMAAFPSFATHNNVEICGTTAPMTTSVNEDKTGINLPQRFQLEQNFPNPFNPSTTIQYSLVKACMVSLKVYNVVGQEVATLVNGRQEAGRYTLTFNANEGITGLSNGVYFYRLEAGYFVSIKKFVFMK